MYSNVIDVATLGVILISFALATGATVLATVPVPFPLVVIT